VVRIARRFLNKAWRGRLRGAFTKEYRPAPAKALPGNL
jgi:hypothetical protein